MSIAKLKAPNATDVMRSEEGNDSLDTFIRQAVGKEPFISFSRAGDSQVQWVQLLNALDQQELPGWPLLTPLKIQTQKCDKCSREFCSPINYRRHIRVQHRLKKLDKDSAKNRGLLRAFWDKLSLDEEKEIVSFKNVALEEVHGSSIIKSLTTLIRKPGFSSLPQVCLRAGSSILDIIQARPSRFPLTSQELFSILDDASENTFLCGTAVLMQRYIFDGEAGKIALEPKNLVACTSFLVEQKLVRAWLADKDAEALRCQKLLVEEEEAAQRRQAELLERKRRKKLRQKEQKTKEQKLEENEDKESIDNTHEAEPRAETCSSLAASDSDTQNPDSVPYNIPSSPELSPNTNTYEDIEHETVGFDILVTGQNVERRTRQGGFPRHMILSRWQVPQKSRWSHVPNGFHASQKSHAQKLGAMQKHGTQRDWRAASIFSGNKVWSRKPKPENVGESLSRVQKEVANRSDQNGNHELLIGSIPVTLGNCSHHEGNRAAEVLDDCLTDDQMQKKSNVQEKPAKSESAQVSTNKSIVKLWRPVSRNGTKGAILVENRGIESEADTLAEKVENQSPSAVDCLRSSPMDDSHVEVGNGSAPRAAGLFSGSLQFSSQDAKDFLAKRWKEAIAADHVKLILHPDFGPSGCTEVQNYCEVAVSESSDINGHSVLGNVENGLNNGGAIDSSGAGPTKVKSRTKPEKSVKVKYIPKRRIIDQ
ncbi:hypothetical protein HS088_TW08G00106 [Tripterygium wilfordii]|uniref:C2H2-type domain-containing protein n=2 Tax=Tripterygium wilfordii TaxID=458696 RepID=A0A7J7DAY4_TRIWF|nr:hypothetical protein HS088_TW08G00106 [Tripterygium wilfordii]